MKLLSIELRNFRQFYGVQKILFSTDNDKNVTLIHAENGVGKTAFLNAILWCFFEKTTENFASPKKLMNDSAAEEKATSVYVRIEFEEDGETYSVMRSRSETDGSIKFVIHQVVGEKYKDIHGEPAVFMNSVIPKDMADYFFFQGEGVGSLAQDSGGSEIRRAVRNILGFKVAEEALGDLKKAKSAYRLELKKVDKGDEISAVESEMAELEESIRDTKDDLEENREALAKHLRAYASADEKLTNSNHEAVKLKHAQRKQLENSLQTRQQELNGALSCLTSAPMEQISGIA